MDRYTDYDPFADVYNRYWGSFATRVVPVLDRLVVDDLERGSTVVDLCCGTGQLAAAFTERGFHCIGVDGSAAMIDLARANAPDAKFVMADARSFVLDEQADVVVSTFDSLNHLMGLSDLEQVFRQVAAVLAPSGVFVFDLNMEGGFHSRWRGSFGVVTDDEVVVARSGFDADEAIGRMDFTLMTRDGDLWKRTDVTLTQRSYPEADVRSALAAAGFDDVEVHDARDIDMDEVGRSFFRCRMAPT